MRGEGPPSVFLSLPVISFEKRKNNTDGNPHQQQTIARTTPNYARSVEYEYVRVHAYAFYDVILWYRWHRASCLVPPLLLPVILYHSVALMFTVHPFSVNRWRSDILQHKISDIRSYSSTSKNCYKCSAVLVVLMSPLVSHTIKFCVWCVCVLTRSAVEDPISLLNKIPFLTT